MSFIIDVKSAQLAALMKRTIKDELSEIKFDQHLKRALKKRGNDDRE